jgi:hypothetical protein
MAHPHANPRDSSGQRRRVAISVARTAATTVERQLGAVTTVTPERLIAGRADLDVDGLLDVVGRCRA